MTLSYLERWDASVQIFWQISIITTKWSDQERRNQEHPVPKGPGPSIPDFWDPLPVSRQYDLQPRNLVW